MASASDSPWYGQPSVPILRPQMIKWFHLKGITTKALDVWICHNWHVTGWYHIWIWNTTFKFNYCKLENGILHTCNMCMCLVLYLLLNRIIAWSLIECWLRSWTCFTLFRFLSKNLIVCPCYFPRFYHLEGYFLPGFWWKKMACPQVIPNFPCLNEAIGMIRHLDIDLPSFPKIPERSLKIPQDPQNARNAWCSIPNFWIARKPTTLPTTMTLVFSK